MKTFTVDNKNSVKSSLANSETGFCPEPGSPDYSAAEPTSAMADMLRPGDQCIQLTIEDNGPNDSDPDAGTIADPAGVAQFPNPPKPDAKTTGDNASSGCSIAGNPVEPAHHVEWWLLGGLLTFMGWRRRKQQH